MNEMNKMNLNNKAALRTLLAQELALMREEIRITDDRIAKLEALKSDSSILRLNRKAGDLEESSRLLLIT